LLAALHPQQLVLRLSRNVPSQAKAQGQRQDGKFLPGATPDGPVTFLEGQYLKAIYLRFG
jgi:hypothetical protein